jgi:hypothetical protein
MEYDDPFSRSFIGRTRRLLEAYTGESDATLLINCLLGLLVLPKEAYWDDLPEVPHASLGEWGVDPKSIVSFGKCSSGVMHEPSLRELVRRLRNAVAHFKVEPRHTNGVVEGFIFRDRGGFRAEMSLLEIRALALALSTSTEDGG